MNKHVMDAYAWIEYFDGTEKGNVVRQILFDGKNEAITVAVTVAEVISKVKMRGQNESVALEAMQRLSTLHLVDGGLAEETGKVHAEIKSKIRDFGLADAFVLAAAQQLNAKIVTGDPHFAKLKNVVFLS